MSHALVNTNLVAEPSAQRTTRAEGTGRKLVISSDHEDGLPGPHGVSNVAGVSMAVDQLVKKIRSLPHDVMINLVDRVLFESHGGQQPAHAQAWSQTLHRRIDEIRSSKVHLIPGEETSAKIRQIVGR